MNNSGCDYKINHFESIKKPSVLGTLLIEEIFNKIKNGDENLPLIVSAREYGKGHSKYDYIKSVCIPTFRFNFLYNSYANDGNIKASTGLIYIDADDVKEIPDNVLVFAKWKSLSNKGFGLLVKVQNLTLANFSMTYANIAKELAIKADISAGKGIQQTVLSYDPNIYINCNSEVYVANDNEVTKKIFREKVLYSSKEKKKEHILANEPSSPTIRLDNTNDFFVGDYLTTFIYFEDKILISKPFVPWGGINKGDRSIKVFTILSQYAMLNPQYGKEFLLDIAMNINKKVFPPLCNTKLTSMVLSIIKKREEGTLHLKLNLSRRIIFNTNLKISGQQKRILSGQKLGEIRREKAMQEIHNILVDWDIEKDGKITQLQVSKKGNMSLSKVKRYWSVYKDFVLELNK